VLPAFLTTILFSISAVCAQRTSRVLGGVEANLWRLVVATSVLALWAHTFGQGFSGKAFPIFVWSGLLGFGVGDVALYQTLPRLGSRLSIVFAHCGGAVVAAVAEWLALGTVMTATQILGASLTLIGVAFAMAPGKHLAISRRVFWIGVFFGSLAALGQGLGAVVSRLAYRVARDTGESVDGLTAAYQRILAGLVIGFVVWLVVRLKRGPRPVLEDKPRGRLWPWVLVNALSGPAIGVGCYQWALSQRGTGVVLPIVALTPLVIIPFSRYVEGERPRKRSLFGGALAALGIFILTGGIGLVRQWVGRQN
jgi:drug/metabolite transporter (DMT)-like permease